MSLARTLQKVKFTTYLGIISIIGYFVILMRSAIGVDLSVWADSILFLIIGFALFVAGGYHMIFHYFKDGLTASEITKIVTILVGVSSMFVGILTMPLFGIDTDKFSTIKIIVSLVAIITIFLEMVADR